MTEVTLTEYETTERTVEKIECDHCGVVVEEAEATTVWMKPTNEAGDTPDKTDKKIIQAIKQYSREVESNYDPYDGRRAVDPREIASKVQTETIKEDVQKHLCEDCVGLREAIAVRETKDYYRAFWEGTKGKIGWFLLLIPTFIFGVAQGMVFANAEAPTLVQRIGGSFVVFLLMFAFGLLFTVAFYDLLTADSSG
jgi:hypothetical protein